LSRFLVVTADDVGLHAGMTDGALAAHERGIVTACSVAAAGRDFGRAAELLRARPSLAVGVHLTLVGAKPLSPPGEVPSLVGPDGAFPSGFGGFLRRYYTGRINPGEVERELRRQIEAVRDAGLSVSHVNGHQHLHVLPRVWEMVLWLAVEYRIAFVRLPVDRQPRHVPLARRLAVAALSRFARAARRRGPMRERTRVGDATIGIAQAGRLTLERIEELLPFVDGVTELVCHPGLNQRVIAGEFPWGYGWETETLALCDPALRGTLDNAGITLVSPADIPTS
jgi:predicted glycoside hydrolase/deacetylase ChbG (UPF0249 family)